MVKHNHATNLVHRKIQAVIKGESRLTFRLHPNFENIVTNEHDMLFDVIALPEPRPVRFKFLRAENQSQAELTFLRNSFTTREDFDTFCRLVGEENVFKWFNFTDNQVQDILSGRLEIEDLPVRLHFF